MRIEQILDDAGPAVRATVERCWGSELALVEGEIVRMELDMRWTGQAPRAQYVNLRRLDDQWAPMRNQRPDAMWVRIETRHSDERRPCDVALLAHAQVMEPSEIEVIVRSDFAPSAALMADLIERASRTNDTEDGETDPEMERWEAEDRHDVVEAIMKTLDTEREEVHPTAWKPATVRSFETGADVGAVRVGYPGEAAGLLIPNGWGDGPVDVVVSDETRRNATMRSRGSYVQILDDECGICEFDCRCDPIHPLARGIYAVHQGTPEAQASVWLQRIDALPDGERFTIRSPSGGWLGHVYGTPATTYAVRGHGERAGWESALWGSAEGPDCELAGAEIRITAPNGSETTVQCSANQPAHIEVTRHQDGRVRIER